MRNDALPHAARKHLLTKDQLATHAGATADDLTLGHRQGNGIRIHRTYIVLVSLAALVFIVIAIALSNPSM